MARLPLGTGLAVAATLTVMAAVTAGLLLIEGPETERGRRIDARRIQDLKAVAQAIDCYWTFRGALPQDLNLLGSEMERLSGERPVDGRCRPPGTSDPETGTVYSYRVVSETSFELCARFAEPSPPSPVTALRPEGDTARSWTHGAGLQCFSLAPVEIALDP